MTNQAMVIGGIVALVIGIVMVLVGIVLYEINVKDKKSQPFYVYLMLVGGLVLAIIGGTVLGIGLSINKDKNPVRTMPNNSLDLESV